MATSPNLSEKLTDYARWLGVLLLVAAALAAATWGINSTSSRDGVPHVAIAWPQSISPTSSARVIGQVHDEDNRPLGGASVQLLQVEGEREDSFAERVADGHTRVLATGSAGADGAFELVLEPLLEGAADDSLAPRNTDTGQLELVAVITHDGDTSFIKYEVSTTRSLTALVNLDRPLYQPGQVIDMRALVLAEADATPMADSTAKVTLRDPRGALIFSEEHTTSAAGVLSTRIALSRYVAQGRYSLAVELAGGESISRVVEVRPFRLPRFEVAAAVPGGLIDPGERNVVEVTATYTHGERLTNAPVEVSLSGRRADGTSWAKTLQGRTRDDGVARIEWVAPPNLAPGVAVRVGAVVTSAGRAEESSTSARVAGARPSIEIIPAGLPSFVIGKREAGFIILKDGKGAPLANHSVEIPLREAEGERVVKVITDERGRARFEWQPFEYDSSIEVRVIDPNNRPQTLSAYVAVEGSYANNGLRVISPIVRAGEQLSVEVQTRTHPTMLVLQQRGKPIASATIPGGPSGTRRVATFQVPRDAAGMASVIALSGGSYYSDTVAPVWIRQAAGDTVEVSVRGEEHRPGQKATVDLKYGTGVPDDRVTFGLVGVDEALYLLAERAEIPIWLAARDDPKSLIGLAANIDALDASDEDGAQIAAARFQRALSGHSDQRATGWEVTSSVELAQSELRRTIWAYLLLVGFLVVAVLMARQTWRDTSREVFSWRGGAKLLAVALAPIPVVLLIGSMFRDNGVAGAVTLWGLLLLGALLESSWRKPEPGFGRWLYKLCYLVVIGFCVAMSVERLSGAVEIIAAFALGVPALAAAIELLVWPFILKFNQERLAGNMLATLMLSPLLFVLAVMAPLSGGVDGAKFAAAPESAPMRVAERFVQFEDEEEAAATGKPMAPPRDGESGASNGASPRVRSYFPETMVWVPELAADDSGSASMDIELPDSITTWRLDAWAHSSSGQFAHGRAGLRVWQPFFVELELPTHLTEGDVAVIPVSIVNNNDTPEDVTLSVESSGSLIASQGERATLFLAAGERRVSMISVRAASVGDGAVTLTAKTASGGGDAVKRVASVSPDGRELRVSRAAIIGEGMNATVNLPDDVIAGSARAELSIMPGAFASATEGLDAMLRQPNGCFEQTSSSNYPNIMILRTLDKIGRESWPEGEAEWDKTRARAMTFASLGYQRILSFQKSNGGFALYPDKDADVMLTAYGIVQLVEMKSFIAIDPSVFDRAVRYLVSKQNDLGSWPVYAPRITGGAWQAGDKDVGQVRATSFVLAALIAVGKLPDYSLEERRTKAIERALAHMDSHIQRVKAPDALALAALANARAERSEQSAELLARLAGLIRADEKGSHLVTNQPSWIGSSSGYANVEATAIMLYTMLATGEQPALVQPMLQFIARSRSPYGGWGSTQATAWALRSLSLVDKPAKGPVTLNMSVADRLFEHQTRVEEPGKLTLTPKDLMVRRFDQSLQPGVNPVSVTTTGQTNAIAQTVAIFAVPWTSPDARVQDELLDVSVRAPRSMTFGARATVRVQVSNTSRSQRAASIAELPLLPGAFVDTEQFDKWVDSGMIDAYELSPRHVRLYIPSFAADQRRDFTYEMVPLLRGEFSLSPARAWLFYTPEPVSERDGGDVSVN